MAENEVLDVGNRRHFKRWRAALGDPGLTPAAVAESLYQDFSEVLRNKLRGKPLYLVLKACASDREALRDVVANFKGRELAKVVEQAHRITRSNDTAVVAEKMTELLINRLLGCASRYALRSECSAGGGRQAEIERAASTKLIACKPEITALLTAALRAEPIPRIRRMPKVRPSVESVLSTSLRSPPP